MAGLFYNPYYFRLMDLEKVELKYLNKMVRHKTKPWLFIIWNIQKLGAWSGYEIQVLFRHPHYPYIPLGQPSNIALKELETDWELMPDS